MCSAPRRVGHFPRPATRGTIPANGPAYRRSPPSKTGPCRNFFRPSVINRAHAPSTLQPQREEGAAIVRDVPDADLGRLYHKEYDRLVRLATILTREVTLAEDVVQEAFVRLLEHPPEDPSRRSAWLRTVVTRLAYDAGRQASLSRRTEKALTVEPTALSSEVEALHQLDLANLQRALATLSERDRRALLLRHAGYRYREIGRHMQVDTAAVGMLLLRALRKLKDAYDRTMRAPGGDHVHQARK